MFIYGVTILYKQCLISYWINICKSVQALINPHFPGPPTFWKLAIGTDFYQNIFYTTLCSHIWKIRGSMSETEF